MTDGQTLVVGIALGVLALVGVAAVAVGARQLLATARRDRRCVAVATGRVVDVVNRGPRRRRGARAHDDEVVAANEAIAAKKRAYQQKRREEAVRASEETVATWHLVVEWAPAGGAPRTILSERGARPQALRRLRTAEVRYDPSDPRVAYLAQDRTPHKVSALLIGAGVALVALCALAWAAIPLLAAQAGA